MDSFQTKFGKIRKVFSTSQWISKYGKPWSIMIGLGVLGNMYLLTNPVLAQNGGNAAPAAEQEAAAEQQSEAEKGEGFWQLSDKERLRDEFPARPTPFEVDKIRETVDTAFQQFIRLWGEERYFELYEWGKKQSRDFITPEEFATRMVRLDWVPVGMIEEEPFRISFRFRTFIYVDASIKFRHKTKAALQFQKRQTFLLLWEDQRWRFDLLQMLRSPFYTPFQQVKQK